MNLVKRNNGFYYLVYFDEDNLTERKISTKSQNKKDALLFLNNFKNELLNRKVVKYGKLISQYEEEYLLYVADLRSEKYVSCIKLSFRMLKRFLEQDIRLREVTTRMLQNFINETAKRSVHSARMYSRTLNAAFNRAVDWEYLETNPFDKTSLPNIKIVFPVFIKEEEFQKILVTTSIPVLREIFIDAFYTGMRLNEITHLKWSSVDLGLNQIVVKNDEEFSTKNKKDRIIPMNLTLQELFVRKRNKDSRRIKYRYVFQKKLGVKYLGDYISKKFKKAVRDAKLNPKIHFHTLRHSFASLLVQ